MTFIRQAVVPIATDASSAGSTNTPTLNGLLEAIHYTRSATGTAMSTTMGVTITGETSGINFLTMQLTSTADVTFLPRAPIHNTTAGSTNAGSDRLPICDERLTIALSSGGASKSGTFRFFVS